MRRLSVVLVVLGIVGSLAAAVPATASENHPDYLALGDSLAFGYNPLLKPTSPNRYVGYADLAAAELKDKLANASCPGETSSHFLNLAGSDNGCGEFRSLARLHVTYSGTQLAYADAFLAEHPDTALVTIDIGANDLNVLVKTCGGRANVSCIMAGLPAALGTLQTNLGTIYAHLRVSDGYTGPIVLLTFPSLDYADLTFTGVVQLLDQVLAGVTLASGGVVADGFGAWAAASTEFGGDTCAAGLRIVTSPDPLTCDDHPSPYGHALLTQAIIDALGD